MLGVFFDWLQILIRFYYLVEVRINSHTFFDGNKDCKGAT